MPRPSNGRRVDHSPAPQGGSATRSRAGHPHRAGQFGRIAHNITHGIGRRTASPFHWLTAVRIVTPPMVFQGKNERVARDNRAGGVCAPAGRLILNEPEPTRWIRRPSDQLSFERAKMSTPRYVGERSRTRKGLLRGQIPPSRWTIADSSGSTPLAASSKEA
jgi:hypothetical protein